MELTKAPPRRNLAYPSGRTCQGMRAAHESTPQLRRDVTQRKHRSPSLRFTPAVALSPELRQERVASTGCTLREFSEPVLCAEPHNTH